MPAHTKITCTKCGNEFNVEDVLVQHIVKNTGMK